MLFRVSAAAVLAVGLFVVSPANAAGTLNEGIVKTVIQKIAPADTFVWRSVKIAPPRKASISEISAAGLPANATVWPVRVDYTEVGTGGWGRDHQWNYYFYQDDFGDWARQSNAMPGNVESDLHKVK